MTYDLTNGLKTYVNGALDGSAVQKGNPVVGATYYEFGSYTTDYSTRNYAGMLDEIRLLSDASNAPALGKFLYYNLIDAAGQCSFGTSTANPNNGPTARQKAAMFL